MLSGWPASAPSASTAPSAMVARRRPAASRPRSRRKSIQGHRQNTAVCGKKSHCEKFSERPYAIAAKNDALSEARSSRTQSHMPAIAISSLSGPSRRNAVASGSGSVSSVKGENAADWLFAASGVPQPFHRSSSGQRPVLPGDAHGLGPRKDLRHDVVQVGVVRKGAPERQPGVRERHVIERQRRSAAHEGARKRQADEKHESGQVRAGNPPPERPRGPVESQRGAGEQRNHEGRAGHPVTLVLGRRRPQ